MGIILNKNEYIISRFLAKQYCLDHDNDKSNFIFNNVAFHNEQAMIVV